MNHIVSFDVTVTIEPRGLPAFRVKNLRYFCINREGYFKSERKSSHWRIQGGRQGHPPGPNSFIFTQFSANI